MPLPVTVVKLATVGVGLEQNVCGEVPVGAAGLLRVIFAPLLVPLTAGLELFTLIRYKEPAAVPAGIVAVIVPLFAVLAKVPIEVPGKVPVAVDNSAV